MCADPQAQDVLWKPAQLLDHRSLPAITWRDCATRLRYRPAYHIGEGESGVPGNVLRWEEARGRVRRVRQTETRGEMSGEMGIQVRPCSQLYISRSSRK